LLFQLFRLGAGSAKPALGISLKADKSKTTLQVDIEYIVVKIVCQH